MITAKPIVKNKYWILRENDKKIGTVQSNPSGYVVRIHNTETEFKTIKTIKNRTDISFEDAPERKRAQGYEVNGFLTDSKPHNAVYDVKRRLPMFTKKAKSKSWYAAGYYQITINGQTETHFCPKVILLQRYPYLGPAHDPEGFYFK